MNGRLLGGIGCCLVALDCAGRAASGKNTVPFDSQYAWVWWVFAAIWVLGAFNCWLGRDGA